MLQGYRAQTSVFTSLGTSLKNLGGQFLSTIVNGFVSLVASTVVMAAVNGIQAYIESAERMAKRAQEITGVFKEQSSQINEYSKKIIELKGVLDDETSSAEDVKVATSELYSIQNDLIGQYGAYHEGIDLINGDLEDQLKLLQNINRENAQRTINQLNDEKTNKVKGRNFMFGFGEALTASLLFPGVGIGLYGSRFINNLINKDQGAKKAFSNALFESDLLGEDRGTNKYGSTTDQINAMVNNYKGEITTANKQVLQLARNFDKAFEVDGNHIKFIGDIYEIDDAITKLQLQLQSLGIADEDLFNQLSQEATGTRDIIQKVGDSYTSLVNAEVQTNGQLAKYYRDLSDIYNEYLNAQNNADTEEVERLAQQYKETFDTIAKSGIDDKYINYFKNLYPELDAVISQWKFEVEILPKIKEHRGLEDFISGNSADKLKTLYRYYNAAGGASGKVDPLVSGRWKTLEQAMTASGYNNMDEYIDYIKSRPEYSDAMNNIKKVMGSNWKDEFEDEFAQMNLTAAIDIKPKPNGMEYTKEEIEEYLSPVEVEAEVKVSSSKAVDSMNDAKTAITSLEELWNQTVQNSLALGKDKKYLDENGNVIKQLNDKNQAIGFADPAMINSVESAFYKFSEALKKEGNDAAANQVNDALEEFEKTLTEFPGDAKKAQGAIDKLITAYIDQTDIIKNLTEENAEWSIAQLKAYGITNAEEVVMSRLNGVTKQLAANFSKAADALNTLTTAQEGSNEYNSAMENVGGQLAEMFSFDMGNGEEISPNFDATWIIQNLALLKEAANGSTDAMWQLQQVAAKRIAAQIDINLPDQNAINGELNYINNLIDNFDISDVRVGTSLDDTPMIKGLNNLVEAGIITRNSMNAILSGIGVAPKIDWEEVDITATNYKDVADAYNKLPGGYTAGKNYSDAVKSGKIGKVKIPKIHYEVDSKGVNAQYSAPSNSTSSSGNGGGGSNGGSDKNKVQVEAGESFDWIEVKIQRLEEAIARLDKQVNNVYKSWTDRNSSLAKEIAKVTEEIKAQEVATKEYSRNAAKVTGSGQVLTDKQVKQQAAAQKAWTSKLQKDIESGKYTTKNKKGKEVLDTKKLKKALGKSYNTYIEEAAQEYFKAVKENEKLAKKKKKKKKINVIVGDNNKPKKSDYGDNTEQYKYDLKKWKEAQKVWATGDYQKKIEEGTMTGDDIETIDNKYLKDAINAYKEIYQKSVDAADKVAELKIQLSDLNRQKLDNIVSRWEELIELTEHEISLIDKYIDRTETMGYWVSEDLYKQQKSLVEDELKQAQKKRDEYAAQFNAWIKLGKNNGGLDVGSEAYYTALNELEGYNEECDELLNNIAEIDKKLRELPWEKFDWLQEKLDDITEEAEFLSEMLSIEKIMDDYGRFNDRGMANLAMLGVQYEEAARKVEDYGEQREILAKQIQANPLNKDLKDEFDRVTDGYREAAKQIASISQNIVSQFQEAIDANLSKLKELMDEYKNTLSSAKDLYSYQKNIQNQTDNIGNLRKQLLAYQGDDSEAARKRRQELTNQLNAAEQQLQETEWDRYISQTGEMLDNLYSDYEELLTAKLDNVGGLVTQLIQEVNEGKLSVANGLKEVLKMYGIETDNFKSFTEGDKQLLSRLENGKLKDLDSHIVEITDQIDKSAKAMEDALKNPDVYKQVFEKASKIVVDSDGYVHVVSKMEDAPNSSEASNNASNGSNNTNTSSNEPTLDPNKKLVTISEGKMVNGIDGSETDAKIVVEVDKEAWQKEVDNITTLLIISQEKLKRLMTASPKDKDERAIANTKLDIERYKRMLHQLNVPGYATGTKHVAKNQWAWTQENGDELIFRRSDGAMLTPLGQGSMVFTNEMSKRLWEIASGNIELAGSNTKLPNINSNNRNNLTLNNEITISLPNVQDYDSFKTALQNDTRFEKFIQEITIGQAMGNNTLNKRKY